MLSFIQGSSGCLRVLLTEGGVEDMTLALP